MLTTKSEFRKGIYVEGASKALTAVDLFCGAGGTSTGLADAGINVLAGVDNSLAALRTYSANHQHPAHHLDLTDVEAAASLVRSYQPDILVGSPPCQDFSNAGPRIEGERADLTYAFARICIASNSKYIVMENVDRAAKAKTYKAAKIRLKNAGYGLTELVLNAAFFGVPQVRKRLVLIGKKGAEDGWMEPPAQLSEKPLTVRGYMGSEIDFDHYYRHARSYTRRAVFSVDEPSPTVRGTSRPVPPGYLGHANDTADVSTVRPLTMFERARIQTFPPSYQWIGARTSVELMVGNAVPPALASAIARSLIAHEKCEQEQFRSELAA